MNQSTQQDRRRLTIGLLIGHSDRLHEREIWQGAREILADVDANLVAFVGRQLQSTAGFDRQANRCYQLVDLQNVDGLLITTTIISAFVSADEMRAFVDQFRHIPVVNIGKTHIPGASSVFSGTYQGVREALDHLLQFHNHRRLAFIKGPDTASSARSRLKAYQEKLAAYNIPYDEALVAPGDYSLESGRAAIEVLVDQRQATFDALFAANDDMALGAMEALQSRGIRVPDDVAVVGIDDKHYARIANPPLTSVSVNYVEQGRQAAKRLLRQLAGESLVGESNIGEPRLIVRRSCGCLTALPTYEMNTTFHATALADRLPFFKDHPLPASMSESQRDQIWRAFWQDQQTDEPHFLQILRRLLQDTITADCPPEDWHQVIAVLRTLLHFQQADQQSAVEDLWQQAHLLISEMARQSLAYQQWQSEVQMRTLHDVAQRLILAFEFGELLTVTQTELPKLGIQGCVIALYDSPETGPLPAKARVVAAYSATGQTILEEQHLTFPTIALYPDGFFPEDERLDLVVEPLYFQDEQLGLAVFQATNRVPGTVFEALRGYLSNALKGASLLRQAEMKTHELEDQVKRQTLELTQERNTLRILIDNLPDDVYMKDREHRFTLINQKMLADMDGEIQVGYTDYDIDPQTAPTYWAEEERVFETGEMLIDADYHLSAEESVTGKEHWYLRLKLPIRDQDDQITGLIGVNRNITEQKQAELDLQAERNLLRAIIDNIPDHIYFKDVDHHFVLVNKALEEVWQRDLIGKTDYDLFPDDRPRAQRFVAEEKRIMANGLGVLNRESFSPRTVGAQSKSEWILRSKIPLYGPDGQAIGILGINRDVTIQKEAELRLEEERSRLRTLIDNIPDQIYMKDRSHRFVLVNEALRNHWDRDVVGLTDHDLLDSDKIEAVIADEQHIMSSGEVQIIEDEGTYADGRVLWQLVTKAPLRNLNGQIIGLIGINRDVTEFKKVQVALTQERNLLRTLIDHLPLEIYAKDRASRFILANNLALHFTEYETMEDIIGSSDLDSEVFDRMPDLAQQHYESEQEMMRTGVSIVDLITPPIVSSQPNAGNRWVRTNKVPLRDSEDNIIGLVGFNQDITVQQEHEVEREQLIAELEARNIEMERFTYTVSHDLRSPLITIKGFVGILEHDIKNRDADRIANDLVYIRTATDQMESLLNDLLNLSRIGRVVNPKVVISLTELATEAVKLVTGEIMKHEVSVIVPPDMPEVKGDRARLLEVFQNLLENAIKYMGSQANPQIEIGAEQRDQEVVVYVRDNGIGVAAEYHEKIFELFDQLDPDSEGTGLGLALVRRIMDYHEGRIWVESDGVGKGSTFYFVLPLPS